jgi:glucose-1-phosphate thymidylyltransferase
VKGVLLAGGTGSRLHPLTLVTNKHLMPVYDRPMIYWPLQTLAGMGIEKVMVILGGRSIGDIVELLSDGRDFGLDLTYRYQRGSLGIAHAIGLTRDFVGDYCFCVVLGDNILRGEPLEPIARDFEDGPHGAGTMLYRVPDPQRFGVAEFDRNGGLVGFEEKPQHPKSDSIPIGVYFLRPDSFGVIESLVPSGRGEFEITDVLNHYLPENGLFWRHYDGHWTDAGTIESLLHAGAMASQAAQAILDASGDAAAPPEPSSESVGVAGR